MTDAPRTVRVVIRGRVQGVGYRDWTHGRARLLGLDGWVRNRSDGAVEALFSGPPGAVAAMLQDAHQGPPLAKVSAVEEIDVSGESAVPGAFQVRYSV